MDNKKVDRLEASGRVTPEEAARLRNETDDESAMRAIRTRHASERVETAVAAGAMSREEAEAILERVRGGEHSRALRSHLARFRVRRRREQPGETS